MITDINIAAVRRSKFYAAQGMQGLTVATNAGTSPNLTGNLVSPESATSLLTEITGIDITALQPTTAADGIDFVEAVPDDIDVDRPIGVTPLYTKDATGTTHVTSFTWLAQYATLAPGGTIVEAATALDTVIGADTQAAATDSLKYYVGNRGVINASKLAQNTHLWIWKITLSAFTASGNDKMWLLGILIDYMPHITIGTGMKRDKPLRTNRLGKTWAYAGG